MHGNENSYLKAKGNAPYSKAAFSPNATMGGFKNFQSDYGHANVILKNKKNARQNSNLKNHSVQINQEALENSLSA